jgi:hypothetical protein
MGGFFLFFKGNLKKYILITGLRQGCGSNIAVKA